jgi:hypothetical protein
MGACVSSPAMQQQEHAKVHPQACSIPVNKAEQYERQIGRVYSAAPLSNSVVISQVRWRTILPRTSASIPRRLFWPARLFTNPCITLMTATEPRSCAGQGSPLAAGQHPDVEWLRCHLQPRSPSAAGKLSRRCKREVRGPCPVLAVCTCPVCCTAGCLFFCLLCVPYHQPAPCSDPLFTLLSTCLCLQHPNTHQQQPQRMRAGRRSRCWRRAAAAAAGDVWQQLVSLPVLHADGIIHLIPLSNMRCRGQDAATGVRKLHSYMLGIVI